MRNKTGVMMKQRTDSLIYPVWGLFIISLFSVLYFAQSIVIPIVLAVFGSFLLSPGVRRLARLGIPRSLGAAIILLLSMLLSVAVINAVYEPASLWLEKLPAEMRAVEGKIRDLRESIKDVQKTTEQITEIAEINSAGKREVVVSGPGILTTVLDSTQSFLIGLVAFFVTLYFSLAYGDKLVFQANRMLARRRYKLFMFRVAYHAQHLISRYLLLITAINIALGMAVTLVMSVLGMPNALVWGVSAAVLNYIPYVGAAINIALVSMVSFLTFDSWAQIILPPLALLTLNTLEGQVVQPMFVGRMFTINPVLVFVSVLLWGWLWGVAGIFLAVPVLMLVKIFFEQKRLMQKEIGNGQLSEC